MKPSAESLRGVLADLLIADQQREEREASGWVVVTIDEESNSIVHATGIFPTPEEALIEAARRKADDERFQLAAPGEEGWTHTVAPLYPSDYGGSKR